MKNSPELRIARARAQRGMTLITAMMTLLILSVMGAIAMQTSTLEERMAGASADRETAFQAAEIALRDAQAFAFASLTPASGFSATCNGGLCLPSRSATAAWESIDWDGSVPIVYGSRTGAPPLSGLTQQPRYIVELFPSLPATSGSSLAIGNKPGLETAGTAYRITAMAWGRKPGTQVMLQSVFVRS